MSESRKEKISSVSDHQNNSPNYVTPFSMSPQNDIKTNPFIADSINRKLEVIPEQSNTDCLSPRSTARLQSELKKSHLSFGPDDQSDRRDSEFFGSPSRTYDPNRSIHNSKSREQNGPLIKLAQIPETDEIKDKKGTSTPDELIRLLVNSAKKKRYDAVEDDQAGNKENILNKSSGKFHNPQQSSSKTNGELPKENKNEFDLKSIKVHDTTQDQSKKPVPPIVPRSDKPTSKEASNKPKSMGAHKRKVSGDKKNKSSDHNITSNESRADSELMSEPPKSKMETTYRPYGPTEEIIIKNEDHENKHDSAAKKLNKQNGEVLEKADNEKIIIKESKTENQIKIHKPRKSVDQNAKKESKMRNQSFDYSNIPKPHPSLSLSEQDKLASLTDIKYEANIQKLSIETDSSKKIQEINKIIKLVEQNTVTNNSLQSFSRKSIQLSSAKKREEIKIGQSIKKDDVYKRTEENPLAFNDDRSDNGKNKTYEFATGGDATSHASVDRRSEVLESLIRLDSRDQPKSRGSNDGDLKLTHNLFTKKQTADSNVLLCEVGIHQKEVVASDVGTFPYKLQIITTPSNKQHIPILRESIEPERKTTNEDSLYKEKPSSSIDHNAFDVEYAKINDKIIKIYQKKSVSVTPKEEPVLSNLLVKPKKEKEPAPKKVEKPKARSNSKQNRSVEQSPSSRSEGRNSLSNIFAIYGGGKKLQKGLNSSTSSTPKNLVSSHREIKKSADSKAGVNKTIDAPNARRAKSKVENSLEKKIDVPKLNLQKVLNPLSAALEKSKKNIKDKKQMDPKPRYLDHLNKSYNNAAEPAIPKPKDSNPVSFNRKLINKSVAPKATPSVKSSIERDKFSALLKPAPKTRSRNIPGLNVSYEASTKVSSLPRPSPSRNLEGRINSSSLIRSLYRIKGSSSIDSKREVSISRDQSQSIDNPPENDLSITLDKSTVQSRMPSSLNSSSAFGSKKQPYRLSVVKNYQNKANESYTSKQIPYIPNPLTSSKLRNKLSNKYDTIGPNDARDGLELRVEKLDFTNQTNGNMNSTPRKGVALTTMGTEKRKDAFYDEEKSKIPGPGTYNPTSPSEKNVPAFSFPKSKRGDMTDMPLLQEINNRLESKNDINKTEGYLPTKEGERMESLS